MVTSVILVCCLFFFPESQSLDCQCCLPAVHCLLFIACCLAERILLLNPVRRNLDIIDPGLSQVSANCTNLFPTIQEATTSTVTMIMFMSLCHIPLAQTPSECHAIQCRSHELWHWPLILSGTLNWETLK